MTLRYHDCFMVMSDVKDADGELMRMFQHSSLWYRRIVADVQLLTGTDFVVPDLNRVPGPLSKAQKHKQWISGEQVYQDHEGIVQGNVNDCSIHACLLR